MAQVKNNNMGIKASTVKTPGLKSASSLQTGKTTKSPRYSSDRRFSGFTDSPEIKKVKASQQPFSKWNFFLIGCCGLLIIIGFLLMLGGGSSIEGGFNPDIFSTRRIVVGPLLAFLGFLLMAFAIFIDPQKIERYIKNKNKKFSGSQKVKIIETSSRGSDHNETAVNGEPVVTERKEAGEKNL